MSIHRTKINLRFVLFHRWGTRQILLFPGEESEEGSSDESASHSSASEDESRDKSTADNDDDDDQWDKFQKRLQKRERLEGRSKSSHPVHCPYFPLVSNILCYQKL